MERLPSGFSLSQIIGSEVSLSTDLSVCRLVIWSVIISKRGEKFLFKAERKVGRLLFRKTLPFYYFDKEFGKEVNSTFFVIQKDLFFRQSVVDKIEILH